MDTRIASAVSAASTSNHHRKQHKRESSLGSLYEVLADLDETQLHYLIQELNHTGHQHVPVSQAVSAFERKRTDSLSDVKASPLPPSPPGVQRQLSKSQRGQLRLQTAFKRAPSLRQPQRQDIYADGQPQETAAVQPSRAPHIHDQISGPRFPDSPPIESGVYISQPRISAGHLPRQEELGDTSILSQCPSDSRKKSLAYRRIPRPEFSLPPGVTVTDLLELLGEEFLSCNARQSPTPEYSSSPSSPFSTQDSPSPFLQKANSYGPRTLRRQGSRLDMALEAERTSSGAEEIGLGMLEPRPSWSVSLGSSAVSTPLSSVESFNWVTKGDSGPPCAQPVVLEGIFDVLKNQ